MTKPSETSSEQLYPISTVSTLTGIEATTIRAWERRYGAIEPARTETGRRRYDDRTVERLQLLKALVDCNESIGSVARLSDERLRERLEGLASLARGRPRSSSAALPARGPCRLAVIAPIFERQLRANAVALPELELVAAAESRSVLLQTVRRDACDVVVLELDALGEDPVGLVEVCRSLPGSPLVVVLYRFARRAALAQLAQAGAHLVQMPARLEQLRRLLLDWLTIESARANRSVVEDDGPEVRATPIGDPEPDAGPARRFDDEQLARLLEVSTGIDCECPNHLSSLVSALVSFEQYSRHCESRNDADAKLHHRLAEGTAQARVVLESLLVELCEHEGLPL